MLLPLLLAVLGVALIIVGQLDLDRRPASTLPPIQEPTATPVALATPTSSGLASSSESPKPTPKPTPIPNDWVAVQMQIESVGINVPVEKSKSAAIDSFPREDAVFILRESSEPGRGTNSYMFGHATNVLFKPLWNVQLGARIKVLMSDGAVLRYAVTEIHPNVACPDPDADPSLNPDTLGITLPLALRLGPRDCSEGVIWTRPTDHERLTLQTSQGYNRNYGELVLVAEPIG
jgi:hypothetical protein